MAHCTIQLRVRVAWWVRPYIQAVAFVATWAGLEPDLQKVLRTTMRGVHVSAG